LFPGEDQGRVMRAGTEYILRLRPWSPRAFLAATAILALAAGIQEMLVTFGMPLYFAAFFPAILLASLVAGAPAGIFAMLLTVPLVWWAFMPPYFEFGPLTPEEYDRIVMFVLGSSLMISFANLCREALLLLRK
jgi:K+-sensing histidine kinase KdpD